jgi:hypothetical protein
MASQIDDIRIRAKHNGLVRAPIYDGLIGRFLAGDEKIQLPTGRLLSSLGVAIEDRQRLFYIGELAHTVDYDPYEKIYSGLMYFLKAGAEPRQALQIGHDSFNPEGPAVKNDDAQAALLAVEAVHKNIS